MPKYIDNKEFEAQIRKCKGTKKANQAEYDKLVSMFYLLAENIIMAFPFRLIDRDDAIQEAVMMCLIKKDKFNPKSGKAFNYFTTVILNHFRQLYRVAKNYISLKERYLERQLTITGGQHIVGGHTTADGRRRTDQFADDYDRV